MSFKSWGEIQALLANNTEGNISPQDLRDSLVALRTPMGELHQEANSSPTVITNTTSYFEAALSGTTVSTATQRISGSPDFDQNGNGKLRYIGAGNGRYHFHSGCSFSITTASANQVIEMAMGKNGTVIPSSVIQRKVSVAGDVGSSAMHVMVELQGTGFGTGDDMCLLVKNTTSASNVTVTYINIFAVGALIT